MARPQTPPGTHGSISVTEEDPGEFRARTRFRDPHPPHPLKTISRAGRDESEATRRLRRALREAKLRPRP